ncbi:MAG: cytochrome C oxidase subunit II [Candidatus Sericytochromatia bacterium]|nr:cytochrome C oxidase subunit II [Candidatus Tanganyikabacteria bacterium]
MPIAPPLHRNWWDVPVGVHEKLWIGLVVATGLGLFVMMPVWHVYGAQNSSATSYRVNPDAYFEKVNRWVQAAPQTDAGIKVTGTDVYLVAMRYAWFPTSAVLETGVPYKIHLSSKDVNHGFSIHRAGHPAQKANFQVVPGYQYVLEMTFKEPGTYNIVCQEYCGIGHQAMVGKFEVQKGQ